MEDAVADQRDGPGREVQAQKINAEKTYARILQHKEVSLQQSALAERRATRLTKQMLKMSEVRQEEKLTKMAEESQRRYEHTMEKARLDGDLRVHEVELAREEQKLMREAMRAKDRIRKEQEGEGESARSERMKWAQARSCWEQREAARRAKFKEDEMKAKAEKIEERAKATNAAHEAYLQEQAEKKAAARGKMQECNEKNEERRKKDLAEQRKAKADKCKLWKERQEQADQRRREHDSAVSEALRKRGELRDQKVAAGQQKAELQWEEQAEKILHKYLEAEEFSEAKKEKLRQRAAEESRRLMDAGRRSRADSGRDALEEGKKDGTKDAGAAANTSATTPVGERGARGAGNGVHPVNQWDVLDVNNRVKKDYVQKCSELKSAAHNMLAHKRYKGLADEAAKVEDPKKDNSEMRKLRWVHERYAANKSTQESSTSSSNVHPSGAMTERSHRSDQVKHLQPCGMCERHFSSDFLVGHILKSVLHKLRRDFERHGSPRLDSTGESQGVQENPSRAVSGHQDVQAKEPSSQAEVEKFSARGRPKAELYDYALPLCTACHQLVSLKRLL
eukprot:TRINITY_DN34119_c0_g1_i1.p1 TRINITY_DN34119_c0_g1~~TRINITY_DN34119_c0_g1_i1.p1  ORF type:complete len:565 (-),score=195.34 TRINITY_DN34119_c0_g1_i1:47-1741(-)